MTPAERPSASVDPIKRRRRFLQVGRRRVHYVRAGDGPPVVLIHSSPANVRLLAKEIERLSRDFTVFAFDTPGFGLSDPLPLAEMEVSDLADAMAETLAAIDMPRCPVFGTHTGAAIALELGVRHPDRVTGLVLDGVPAFTEAECRAFFADYFRVLPLSDLGGHYGDAWTRFRDQAIWFPWCERVPENLNDYDLSPPHSTDLWVSMFFEAAEHYAPAYRAASFYGGRAITAARALTVPATYTAAATDMLHPHLDRLPPMRPGQAIIDIGNSFERKRELIAERFAALGADEPAPDDGVEIGSAAVIARHFVDGSAGPLHLRVRGDRDAPALVLLHDAPGSSEQSEALIEALGRRFFVIAPDLPGHGESEAFAEAPTIETFADEIALLLDRIGIDTAGLYGIGFGSSAAIAFAERHPSRTEGLALQGVALPTPAERMELLESYAPPIAIEADGGHWYRTWLMLRDSQIYWPWYDRRRSALRRVEADFSARPLHRWTMDVMRGRESYAHLIHAALRQDAEAILARMGRPLVRITGSATPLAAHDARLRALRPSAATLEADRPDLPDRLGEVFSRHLFHEREIQ